MSSVQSPLPLYLRLLFEQIRYWRSDRTTLSVGSDVASVLSDLFEDLSRPENHGEGLVSRTLGLIAAARHGLTEDELLDNLSTDEWVMEEFRQRSGHSPDSRELPPIVWSRLRADLEPYLSNRGADSASLLAFFHRQFREYVVQRYLVPEKIRLHRHLASYFASQPLYTDTERRIPNLRKLSELPFQQVNGALRKEAQSLLLSFDFLDAKTTATGPQTVLDDFDRVLASDCCTNRAPLEQVRDAIRSRAHVLRGDPGQLPAQLAGFLCEASEPELVQLLVDAWRRTSRVWLRPITRSLGTASEALVGILGGHQAVVLCVSASLSGHYAVSGGNDNICAIWDLQGFVELHRLPHDEPVFAAAITPDERKVVCAAGSTLTLWDLMRGVRLQTQQPQVGRMRALGLTRDGCVVFGSDKGVVGTWDLMTGAITRLIHTFPVSCLAILPDNETIVVGKQKQFGKVREEGPMLAVWNIRKREMVRSFGDGEANSIVLAPNGRNVVVATDSGWVQFWRIEDGSLEQSYQYAHWWADGVSITPDGRYVLAGGVERCIRVWDTTNNELHATLQGHHNIVSATAVVVPRGQQLISGSHDQSVRVWDLHRAKTARSVQAHEGKVYALCQSPDCQWIVSASADRDIKFWDPHTGRHSHTLTGHSAEIWSVAFTPDGTTLLTLQNWRTIVWDVATRQQRRVLNLVPRATAFSNRIVPCADNRHFFCGGEMFEIETGKVADALPEYESGVVAALPDGEHVVFHGNGTLRVWNIKTQSEVATLCEFTRCPVALSDDNLLVVGGYEVLLWDVRTWKQIRSVATGHRGEVSGIAACSDFDLIATVSGDHDAMLWNLEKGEHLATFTAEAPLSCCLISFADPVLVVSDDIGNLHFLRVEGLCAVRNGLHDAI